MTSVYPREEEKPPVPPTYEQATHYPQAPPVSGFYGIYTTSGTVLQPQAPPAGMYSPSGVILQPPSMSMYSASNMDSQGQGPPMGMYPPSNMYPQGQGPPVGTHMLITTQSLLYGDMPIQCTCPHCHQTICTRVEKKTALLSWLLCGGILLFGGWLGCCLIPFCMDSLKDTEHYCPNCSVLLGTRRRM